MRYEIQVENIKCGGCANSIRGKLGALEGVSSVEVDVENGIVSAEAAESMRELLTASLLKMGYPEAGTAEGIAAAKARAKSFVSCAVGRMSGD